MHSGKLTGYSEGEGMGSEFRCELPALKLWKGASVGTGQTKPQPRRRRRQRQQQLLQREQREAVSIDKRADQAYDDDEEADNDVDTGEQDGAQYHESNGSIIGFLEFCAKQQILEEGYEVACGTPTMHNGSGSGIFGRVLSALSSSTPSTPTMHGQVQTGKRSPLAAAAAAAAAAVRGPLTSASGGSSVSAPGPEPGASVVSVLGSMSTAAAAVAALGIQIPPPGPRSQSAHPYPYPHSHSHSHSPRYARLDQSAAPATRRQYGDTITAVGGPGATSTSGTGGGGGGGSDIGMSVRRTPNATSSPQRGPKTTSYATHPTSTACAAATNTTTGPTNSISVAPQNALSTTYSPLATPTAHAAKAAKAVAAAAAAARVGAKTVLVVDDAAPARKVLIRWLQNIGFRCIDAVDGQDCLDVIDALIAKQEQQLLLQQKHHEKHEDQSAHLLFSARTPATDGECTDNQSCGRSPVSESDGSHKHFLAHNILHPLSMFTSSSKSEAGTEGVTSRTASKSEMQLLSQQPIDFIFMDFEMPRLNGPSATLALRKRGITVPIIGVTGNVLSADTEFFIKQGASSVFHKPLDLMKLQAELNKYRGTV
jgi:CheY-like chemotaxis protein